jgi:isocitrate dehydrogenase (NAD+)
MDEQTQKALDHFAGLVAEQLARVERMKAGDDWIDYLKTKPVIIGIVGGDGIGPYICREAQRVLEFLLQDEEGQGLVAFRTIEGLTIENRAQVMKAIPDDVLEEIKVCHVILKGPTTTPRKGDPWPNVESANVAMRRALDLFANVRPVSVPQLGVDWVFFRENTEGEYILGSKGVNVTPDLAIDFKATTTQGAERIVRLAFEYARLNHVDRVTAVTKANVVKTTDGKFLDIARQISAEYPEIHFDDWYIDIMAAKLLDPERRSEFRVIVLPNLYGDIITDEAAQIQGGVGTAGSANIGKRYAMFEAIHGSAPRMVQEGRAEYADPSSVIRAAAMLLAHIGRAEQADRLNRALELCTTHERKFVPTGRPGGATGRQFADYVMETLQDPDLSAKVDEYRRKAASG